MAEAVKWTASGGTTFDLKTKTVAGVDELAEDLRGDAATVQAGAHVAVYIRAPDSVSLDLNAPSVVDLWVRSKAARRGQTVTCDEHVEPIVSALPGEPGRIY